MQQWFSLVQRQWVFFYSHSFYHSDQSVTKTERPLREQYIAF
jgi:hypothetical protein